MAKVSMKLIVLLLSYFTASLSWSFKRGRIIESAPLHITLILPVYKSLNTDVMRFLVELNSIVVRS